MEELTLPEPAASLWREKREIIHSLPMEPTERVVRPHLGGGTTLAARIGHRLSTDIDILLPGRNSLIDLAQDNNENIIERLGGTAEAVTGGRIKIAVRNGEIDLSILRPTPSEGQHEALIDGQPEMVLTNGQILRGKLERPERRLVRDVVDVLVTAEADPQALATAASLLTPERVAAIAHMWRNADSGLSKDFEKRIKELDPQWTLRQGSLGTDAGNALLAHRYRRVTIEVGELELTIIKTIRSGTLPAERYAATEAARSVIASGIGGHLNNNGPIGEAELMHRIREAQARGDRWTFDTGEGNPRTRADGKSRGNGARCTSTERADRAPRAGAKGWATTSAGGE